LVDYNMLKYSPSRLAASSILLSNKLLRRQPAWKPAAVKQTRFTEQMLKECAKEMCSLLENAEHSPLQAVRKKFSQLKYHSVAKLNFTVAPGAAGQAVSIDEASDKTRSSTRRASVGATCSVSRRSVSGADTSVGQAPCGKAKDDKMEHCKVGLEDFQRKEAAHRAAPMADRTVAFLKDLLELKEKLFEGLANLKALVKAGALQAALEEELYQIKATLDMMFSHIVRLQQDGLAVDEVDELREVVQPRKLPPLTEITRLLKYLDHIKDSAVWSRLEPALSTVAQGTGFRGQLVPMDTSSIAMLN